MTATNRTAQQQLQAHVRETTGTRTYRQRRRAAGMARMAIAIALLVLLAATRL
ncbi:MULTISPECIES: hypothetical protein [Luteimonas]|uniref:hypothetical protein n=1 Tax=Luteimonas TaxID=83614 RepID=UPI001303F5CC|nr:MULTISPECIES: hypothetical protein [Luteimonas]